MGTKKIILAYSGGLDTSVATHWYTQRGFHVVCFSADIGQSSDVAALKKRAFACGAKEVIFQDLKREFLERFAFKALKAQAAYEGKYLLATALSRPLIVEKLAAIAKSKKIAYVAHGCTGKGNDQVRIETSLRILAPLLKISAPLREWEMTSREQEIEYAKKYGLQIDVTKKKPYSIDLNLWGVSIEGGVIEDLNREVPEDAYIMTASKAHAKKAPTYVRIGFKKGVPCALNGKTQDPVSLVSRLNALAGNYAIGRQDLMEDRLVGIKTREIYEAPAATVLYYAHKELESLVLDRETVHFKETVSSLYAKLVYYGLWHTFLKDSLDAFVEKTQEHVTGEVTLRLSHAGISVASRRSAYGLYNKKLSTYGKEDVFDHAAAEGFLKLWALPFTTVRK